MKHLARMTPLIAVVALIGCGGDEPDKFESAAGATAESLCLAMRPSELATALRVEPTRAAVSQAVARRSFAAAFVHYEHEIQSLETIEAPTGEERKRIIEALGFACRVRARELRGFLE